MSTSSNESSGVRRASCGPTRVFKGHTKWVSSVAYFPDGRHIASASRDGTIIIWDVENGRQDGQPLHHGSNVRWIAISPDGRRIASGMLEGGVVVWDVLTREVVHELKGRGIWQLAYSPHGQWIATSPMADERVVQLWDVGTERPREPLKCGGSAFCVAFSPDGLQIAVGSWDGSFEVFDISTGESVVGPIKGHTQLVSSVVYSPDGRLLVTASWDKSIQVWNSKTGVQIGKRILGHNHAVDSISITADGRRIASAGLDMTVRVWDLETRLQVGDSFDAVGRVVSVAFSPDSRYIISGGDDRGVCLWDTESIAIQGSSSPPTANNQKPLVRDRARSVSSILDLPVVPEPVVAHQNDSSPPKSESFRRASFDSILDLSAVLEPGKQRPKKKGPHSTESIHTRLPQQDPPHEQETSSVQPAKPDHKWSRKIRQRWRHIRHRNSRVQTDLPDGPPDPPLPLHEHAQAPASPELPTNQQPRRERAAGTLENAQASHSRIRPSRNQNEAIVAFGKLDERLYAAPPRDRNERRRWRARERRRATRNHDSDTGTEPEDNDADAESYYEDTGCLDAVCFGEYFRRRRHLQGR